MSKRVRCAIYTRKSTEEGLEQEFNSLDAQREACEAYVQSQRGQGWVIQRKRYDDAGLSGGTIDRPALQDLLADIERGEVDLVVVYKVDRLREYPESCALGHSDEKERSILWQSRRNYWTSCWRGVIRKRYSPRTVCLTSLLLGARVER